MGHLRLEERSWTHTPIRTECVLPVVLAIDRDSLCSCEYYMFYVPIHTAEMYILQHGIVIRARDHRQTDAVAPVEDEGVEGADPVRQNQLVSGRLLLPYDQSKSHVRSKPVEKDIY
jgi:hypothetical protein